MKTTEILAELIKRDVEKEQNGESLSFNNTNVFRCDNVISMKSNKKENSLTIEVTEDIAQDFAKGALYGKNKFVPILFLVNIEEYEKIKTNYYK